MGSEQDSGQEPRFRSDMTVELVKHCAADSELIFGPDIGGKYERALRKIGIDLGMLSNEAGHA